MRNGKAIRLPALILVLGSASAVLTTVVTAEVLNFAWFSIASTILVGLGFLFKQLDVFEKVGDTSGLTATEVWQVNMASRRRRSEIKKLLLIGLIASGLVAAPWLAGKAGIDFVLTPLLGLALGCILGLAVNCVFVYFDWREDIVQMQQTAKLRAAQQAEAEKSLQRLSVSKPIDFGKFDGFRSH